MKLSTKARYGVRAMVDMAMHHDGKPMLVKDIAKRQQVSGKYLEHVLLLLKKRGFVRSVPGAKGGYLLARDPASVTVGELVESLEGSLAPVDCVVREDVCPRSGACVTRDIWIALWDGMRRILDSFTLSQMVERAQDKRSGDDTMFGI